MARFTGKVVAITGASGGLGRAAAQGFAAEDAELVLIDVESAGLDETARMLRAGGTTCGIHQADLSQEEAITALGTTLRAAHPKIDVLYNNAGLAYGEINHPIETLGMAKWLRFLALNSVAPLLLAEALRPSLAAAKGVILNQSSMASFQPGNAYGVTKATLNAITYAMASSFGRDGIRVNAIAPGLMETPASNSGLTAEKIAQIQGMQMIKGHGLPDDIVKLALFLASDDARFITAEVMSCDAGSRVRGWRY